MAQDAASTPEPQRLVLVTGPSGAGRSTAINVLEDIGFEAIDNLPLSLMPRLLEGPPLARPLALGVDARNRDFSMAGFVDLLAWVRGLAGVRAELLFLDCDPNVLLRRYSETRRRHPLAPAEDPAAGIRRETDLLAEIREHADLLVDTSEMTIHDLRAEIERWFAPENGPLLAISLQSFSYKRGLPRGADMVIDCRFLRNPYWDPALRALNGTNPAVADHVSGDDRYAGFLGHVLGLSEFLLPAFKAEGKAHLAIAFGCTGGQHRSVAVTEEVARALASKGWQVSIRHRELERTSMAATGAAQAVGAGAGESHR